MLLRGVRAEMETIVICIPAREYPDFPKMAALLEPVSFVESKCDKCQIPIWLGVLCKIICDGGVPKVCPHCAVTVYGVTGNEMVQTMSLRSVFEKRNG